MAVETGDLMYVTVRGRLHGQRTINTFWYTIFGDAPDLAEVDAATAFMAQWQLDHGDVYTQNLSQELTDCVVRCQLLRPQPPNEPLRWAYVQEGLSDPDGQVAEGALPSYVTACFRRMTALAGQRYRGRIFVPGIPTTFEADSELTQSGYDALTASIGAILVSHVTENGHQWVPCITNQPDHSRITFITHAVLDTVLRAQRRREVGVGE